jgi:uncharacterized protein involved in exopolysaccharide biosynthesis
MKQIAGIVCLITGLVLCALGAWTLMLPPQYAATARVQVDKDEPLPGSPPDYSYDPYFIQTEFEVMKSEVILDRVITDLKLNKSWGKGAPLTTAETRKMLEKHLYLAPVRNTRFIEVTFYDGNAKEAADVANAIVRVYVDYRREMRLTQIRAGINALQQEYAARSGKIRDAQTKLELLRLQYNVTDPAATNHPPEQQPYWDEKQKVAVMQLTNLQLNGKITDLPELLKSPWNKVRIAEDAKPPESPATPNRRLGIGLLAAGFLFSGGGYGLLRARA